MHLCWPAIKNLYSSALSRHWKTSRGFAKSGGWQGRMARDSQRNSCQRHNLMTIIIYISIRLAQTQSFSFLPSILSPIDVDSLSTPSQLIYKYNKLYLYFTSCEFFMLAYGLLPESESTLCLQDSSQYSSWSQQWYSLDYLDSSFDFHLFWAPYNTFGDRSKRANYNWYQLHPRVPQLS